MLEALEWLCQELGLPWHSCSAQEELRGERNVIRKSAPAAVCSGAALQWARASAGFVPGSATAPVHDL